MRQAVGHWLSKRRSCDRESCGQNIRINKAYCSLSDCLTTAPFSELKSPVSGLKLPQTQLWGKHRDSRYSEARWRKNETHLLKKKFAAFKRQLCDWNRALGMNRDTDEDVDGHTSIILTYPCYKLNYTSCSFITLVTLIRLVLNIIEVGYNNIGFNKFLSYIWEHEALLWRRHQEKDCE